MLDSYYGRMGGEELPIGITIAYGSLGMLSGGVGTPIFDTAILSLGERNFGMCACRSGNSTSLLAWKPVQPAPAPGAGAGCGNWADHIFSAKQRSDYPGTVWRGETQNQRSFCHGCRAGVADAVYEWTAAIPRWRSAP